MNVIGRESPHPIILPVFTGLFMLSVYFKFFQTMQNNHHSSSVQPVHPGEVRHITLSPNSCLNQDVIDSLEEFFSSVPPRQLKQDILEIFLLFLTHDPDTPGSFKGIASDYHLLFQFLDKADQAIEALNPVPAR